MFRRALTLLGQSSYGLNRLPRPTTRGRSSRAASGKNGPSGPSSAGRALAAGLLEAGVASGGLSLLGDVLAQSLTSPSGFDVSEFDWKRAARIGSFGFLIYGPYQYWWYRALAKAFPSRSIPHFAAKVTANQVILGPVIVSAIFAWNLWLQGEAHAWPNKMKMDFTTTVVNGWKFWVPAASVNFFAVPVHLQVWYMSACGLLWVAYLSYSSAKHQDQVTKQN